MPNDSFILGFALGLIAGSCASALGVIFVAKRMARRMRDVQHRLENLAKELAVCEPRSKKDND